MASNTPNLNLLKKDPVTDGNDTFNVRTMLNENWDKIDAAVGEVREELQDIDIPDASLTQAGIVQLSNETSGSRENVAATEKAVSQAFQAGNERKAEVVAALVALGVQASTSETWAQLIPKMATIIKASGNATAADLLIGKTASNANGPFTGTMPDRGAATITPSGTAAATIPDGAYKGAKVAQVSVPAAKVLNDTTIAGVKGTIPNRSEENFHMPGINYTAWAGDRVLIQPLQGFYNGASWVTAPAPDLLAENIRAGKNILGIPGSLKPMTHDFYDYLNSYVDQSGNTPIAIKPNGDLVCQGPSNTFRVFNKQGTLVMEVTWAQALKYFRGYYSDNELFYYYRDSTTKQSNANILNSSGTVLKVSATFYLYDGAWSGYSLAVADANYWYVKNYSRLEKFDKNLTKIADIEVPNSSVNPASFSSITPIAAKLIGSKIYYECLGSTTYSVVYDIPTNTFTRNNIPTLLFLV